MSARSERVDFGRTAHDYATHRAGFPPRLFDELRARGVVGARDTAERVLDLGTGTGTLARGFAAGGARVVGLDISAELLEQARALAAADGLSIDFRQGAAEQTGLADAGFDLVAAGQCWHWFDRPRVAREVMRLLRPGGRVLVAHWDYLALPDNVVARTNALIERLGSKPARGALSLGAHGVYPAWFYDLQSAGFAELAAFTFDEDVAYSDVAWRGRMRASHSVGGSMTSSGVARFDRELADLLASPAGRALRRGADGALAVPHRCFCLVARRGDHA